MFRIFFTKWKSFYSYYKQIRLLNMMIQNNVFSLECTIAEVMPLVEMLFISLLNRFQI